MTEELKARIAQINAGTAPAGYKKTKVGIVPEDWEKAKLGDLFTERIEQRCEELELLAITAKYGIIPRSQLDLKDNASEDNFYRKMLKRYKVIQKTLGIEHIAMTDISISGAINRIKKLADESKRDIIDYALDYENAKIIRQILRDYNRNSASSYQMLQKSIVKFFE